MASVYLEEIPAYWELYYTEQASRIPFFQPHLVIRGTFLPDTSSLCPLRNTGTPTLPRLRCRGQGQASISYTVLSMYE